jgi:predicted cupin superfamily sugar epimerase
MTADELIQALGLAPHPEGGWYRETWRAEAKAGERAAASAVLYVIEPGQRSHWNRVDAHEIWLWHAGDPLDVMVAATDAGPSRTVRLGGRVTGGEQPQLVIPAGQWQSAVPIEGGTAGYTLISCIVAPAFEFGGFELAVPGWAPGLAREG